jgi:hypothetical protein
MGSRTHIICLFVTGYEPGTLYTSARTSSALRKMRQNCTGALATHEASPHAAEGAPSEPELEPEPEPEPEPESEPRSELGSEPELEGTEPHHQNMKRMHRKTSGR